MDKSHLYVGGVVLRNVMTEETVHAFASKDAAIRWCRQNGWRWFDGKD